MKNLAGKIWHGWKWEGSYYDIWSILEIDYGHMARSHLDPQFVIKYQTSYSRMWQFVFMLADDVVKHWLRVRKDPI